MMARLLLGVRVESWPGTEESYESSRTRNRYLKNSFIKIRELD